MAGTALTHDTLIQAFERRFDHYSARAVVAEVLENAGLKKSDAYDAAALARISSAIQTSVQRPESILAGLTHANGAGAAAEPKHAAKAAHAHAEAAEPKHDKHEAKAAKAEPAEAAAPAPEAKADAAEAAPAGDEAADKPAEKKAKK